MYSIVHTAMIHGIDSCPIEVETDISDGMPVFEMVGYLSSEVREARDRVRTALKNCGYHLPVKRITVNLFPGNIRKSGSGFDVPVAVSLLAAMGQIPQEALEDVFVTGELSLDGSIHGIPGVLPMVLAAKEAGASCVILPADNRKEGALVPDMKVVPVHHIHEIISFLQDGVVPEMESQPQKEVLIRQEAAYDFSEINGQKLLKRACEVAVSGMHNLLMVGPPGAGKTMVARCIPSILPEMTPEEQMKLSKIYSVCGKFGERDRLMNVRPFRSPHHTITVAGLVGGGARPMPGEISLAHGGVLFLDELTEFRKSTIEVLRQPLEDRKVQIARNSGTVTYPSDFVLVAAMNPCNCGYFPDMSRCRCTPASISRYMGKLSQPMMDRMDVCVEAPVVGYRELVGKEKNETSEQIRKRVERVHMVQKERFAHTQIAFNSRIPPKEIESYCALGTKEQRFMEQMYEKLELTARSYHKLLRVARTIADMAGSKDIGLIHLQEAVCYRGLNKKFWENCI